MISVLDLALDPLDEDLLLTDVDATLETDRAALAAGRVDLRLAVVRGEYVLDALEGADWLRAFSNRPGAPLVRAVALEAILGDPEVAAATVEVATDDRERTATVTATSTTTFGAEVVTTATVGG